MSWTRVLAVLAFLSVLGGTLAMSQPGDLAILAKVGSASVRSVRDGLPESAKFGGALSSFHAGDALPVSERVRVRIQTDKDMAGAEVSVVTQAGQVRLRGVVQSVAQKSRAVELAERTAGVESVVEELATPP
jgi:hypothetical protein